MIVIIADFRLRGLVFFLPFLFILKKFFLLPCLTPTPIQFLLLINFSSSSFFSKYIISSPHPFSHFWIVFVWFWFFFFEFRYLFPFSFFLFFPFLFRRWNSKRNLHHHRHNRCLNHPQFQPWSEFVLFWNFFFFWGGKSKMKIIFFPFSVIFPQQWRSLKSGWMRTSCHGRVPPTWSRKNLRQQWTKLE